MITFRTYSVVNVYGCDMILASTNDPVLLKFWSAENHPILSLSVQKRKEYLEGLGAALYEINGDDPVVSFLFSLWAKSILADMNAGVPPYKKNDKKTVRNAIQVERRWWCPFRLSYSFFFDCLYLTGYGDDTRFEACKNFLLDICYRWGKKDVAEIVKAFQEHNLGGCKKLDFRLSHIYDKSTLSVASHYKKVLLVANVSAGKSTLINALTGYRLCSSSNLPCTHQLHYVFNKPEAKEIICVQNGCYRDISSFPDFVHNAISLQFSSSLSPYRICLIDTPGINNSENKDHSVVTCNAIQRNEYDLLLYVSNANYFDTTDERAALKQIALKCKKPMLFVLNQLDSFDPEQDLIQNMLEKYKRLLLDFNIKKPVIVPVSGYAKLFSGISDSDLSEVSVIKKHNLEKLFVQQYYDLPSYLNVEMADKTGVSLLEKYIIQLLSL